MQSGRKWVAMIKTDDPVLLPLLEPIPHWIDPGNMATKFYQGDIHKVSMVDDETKSVTIEYAGDHFRLNRSDVILYEEGSMHLKFKEALTIVVDLAKSGVAGMCPGGVEEEMMDAAIKLVETYITNIGAMHDC